MQYTMGNDLVLGHTRDGRRPFVLSREARAKHVYVPGGTGSGKSKLMEHAIRQDILAWPNSGSGMLLLDPHGRVFDDLMVWLSAHDMRQWPIIPIDLRRASHVIAYNPLRQRVDGDPAVVVANLIRGILHAWGQGNSNETPRLARWLYTILMTLYTHKCTLAEALHMIREPQLRLAMSSKVADEVAQTTWMLARDLREGEFLEQVESTIGRIVRLLGTRMMKATLGQSEATLDFGRVLREGSIVLVALAESDSFVDEEDTRTMGAIMLADLWTAAKCRGKGRDGDEPRPFYVFCDEAQQFVSPTIAKTLDQARGFGIHMWLTNQYPTQLLDEGEYGRRLFNSIMANCRSKVVFQTEHPEDVQSLALWLYRSQLDLDEIKFQPWTTKVMGHYLAYLPSFGANESVMEGESNGTAEGSSSSSGGSSSSISGSGTSWMMGGGVEDAEWATESSGESSFESEVESESWSESHSQMHSRSNHEARTVGGSQSISPMLIPVMGQEKLPPIFRTLEEQLFRITQYLAVQPDRHCIVRVAGHAAPVSIVTATVQPGQTTDNWKEFWVRELLGALDCAVPMDKACALVDSRRHQLMERFNLSTGIEPVAVRRRITAK